MTYAEMQWFYMSMGLSKQEAHVFIMMTVWMRLMILLGRANVRPIGTCYVPRRRSALNAPANQAEGRENVRRTTMVAYA